MVDEKEEDKVSSLVLKTTVAISYLPIVTTLFFFLFLRVGVISLFSFNEFNKCKSGFESLSELGSREFVKLESIESPMQVKFEWLAAFFNCIGNSDGIAVLALFFCKRLSLALFSCWVLLDPTADPLDVFTVLEFRDAFSSTRD